MKPKETPVKNKAAADSIMNLKDIESLIKFVQGSGVAEVSLEQKDFKITIKTTHGAMVVNSNPSVISPAAVYHTPVQHSAPAPAPLADSPKPNDESKYQTIKSPMIGTFYRSLTPDKPVFVNVGD